VVKSALSAIASYRQQKLDRDGKLLQGLQTGLKSQPLLQSKTKILTSLCKSKGSLHNWAHINAQILVLIGWATICLL